MISSDFVFDTAKIKKELNWNPTKTNEEMLCEAYDYYRKNKEDIWGRREASAHRTCAKEGVIKLLKKVS